MSDVSNAIESVLHEDRKFPPSPEFAAHAHISSEKQYQDMWQRAKDDPAGFWGELALSELEWFKPFDKALEGTMPENKWFTGGRINVSYNCLDRHLKTWRKNKAAIIWEGEPGDTRTLTYQQLHHEVCKFARVLDKLGIKAGDRVTLYMPMIPELAIAMLACARVGATHSIIFGGFSADAITDRNHDAQSKLIVTADGGWRRGKEITLKDKVDASLEGGKSPSVEKVVVVRRTGSDVDMVEGRDLWWHDLMDNADADREATPLDSEHPLFILYTSGSTGKPKGVLHTTAGYLLGVTMTSRWVFDLKDEDTYWCTADIGWVTGHSYIVYGPLSNGATTMMYEGAPNWPDYGRFWDMIERHKVNIFYTAPTAIRAFVKWGDEWPQQHDLSSLRLLGTVGEPINPEAWMWYHRTIGGERCPVVDTWWQTETGGILISSLAGVTDEKPGYAAWPLPGVQPVLLTADGKEIAENEVEGLLAIKFPWPSIIRTTYGDHGRCRQTYFSNYKGYYFTGDGARRDAEGRYRIIGRVDDVINVSGHRFGTAEIENAINESEWVVESAVVGFPHDIKGQGIYAYVIAEKHVDDPDKARADILATVTKVIGPIAKPDKIQFVSGLPKTRSGKIMRRILRKVAENELNSLGDTSTLLDPAVVDEIKAGRV
ncbi:MAG: acetate--CoA ligase [Planctomycetaceae bacterium]|nr:acetate--CoA ligase [Planctomycetaceae bacterium]